MNTCMNTSVEILAREGKAAAAYMATSSETQKNTALQALIQNIKSHRDAIMKANQQDINLAKAANIHASLLERLSLENRLEGIIHDIEQVIRLPDPIGTSYDVQTLPNGLVLSKCRVPLGVLGVIYESRPNVTIDISALTIKSANVALLRGGSETLHTNQALIEVIQQSLKDAGLPATAIQLLSGRDRTQVSELLQLDKYIDVIIPRGGAALQQFCRKHSTIPVITGGAGVCHLFVDETADFEGSLRVIFNAKTQRPGVCNAVDTILVHAAIAKAFIPRLQQALQEALSEKRVQFCLDHKAWACVGALDCCRLAKAEDWDTEWLSLVLNVKVVENIEEATAHIKTHASGHSDGILTENPCNAAQFIREVDSAAVYVNASTRFTDGGQFGLGGEAAISTQKLHARGPMGLQELTSYKWIIRGNYQIRT